MTLVAPRHLGEEGSVETRRGDLLLAALVAVVLAAVVTAAGSTYDDVEPVAYLWAVGFGLLMLVRRDRPLLVLALTTVGFFSYYASGFPPIGVGVPMAAALYSAAEVGAVRAAIATGVVVLGLSTAYRLAVGQGTAFVLGYELVYHASLMAAAVALGHVVRVSRALRRRTDQVTGLLVRQGELDASARLREERLSLARELHDSLGHSLSVAGLYAQVAQEAGSDRTAGTQALALVRESVLDGLAHLRRTVAVLRSPRPDDDQAPGLADVAGLMTAPRAAGYDTTVEVADVDVPESVGTAAYRVVQEAVTNAIRHSTGNRIEVRVAVDGDGPLEVTVRDDGRTPGRLEVEPGHGLAGMRERLRTLGGTLDVTPGHSGWTVRARIPLPRPADVNTGGAS